MRRTVVVFPLVALGAVWSAAALAAPGDLDRRFGDDGKVRTNVSGRGEQARGAAVQADGKIVVVGWGDGRRSDSRFAVARYNPGGRLDRTFSGDGVARTNFADFGDVASAVAIQPDGKIVVVGTTEELRTSFALARFNADGTLDTSFGDDGHVTSDFRPYDILNVHSAYARAVAIQDDGKIVVAGSAALEMECCSEDFALARYNSDGTLDSTFGDAGLVTTDVSDVEDNDYAHDVAIQGDGKIVAAGGAGTCCGGVDFGLARYNADGTLDSTFDDDGKLTTSFVHGSPAAALAIQGDGKIVAAGKTSRRGGRFALMRYNADGTLDTTFGGDGRAATNFTPERDRAMDVAVQGNGKIIAVGLAGKGDSRFAVARYNPNGALDTSFGGDGKATTNFSTGEDWAEAVVIQSPTRVVAVGVADDGPDGTFALARYRAG